MKITESFVCEIDFATGIILRYGTVTASSNHYVCVLSCLPFRVFKIFKRISHIELLIAV